MDDRARYTAEVAQARRAAHALRVIAAITVGIGIVAILLALLAIAVDALPWDEAENLLWVLGAGSIVSGIVMFGSSWSLRIGASRMEIDIASKLG